MAGYGREVGAGGGFIRLGQEHSWCGSGVVVALTETSGLASSVLSSVGNLREIIPKSTHASLLGNNLSVLSGT